MALFPEFLWPGSKSDHLSTPSFVVTNKWRHTSTPLYTFMSCTETAVPVSTCKVPTVTPNATARTHSSTAHKTANHFFKTRTPVEPSYITHIPTSLYQICNTRSNNDYLRPLFTPTNTQNNLISHTLLWVVNARRSVLTACHCFVSKWLWVQLRIALCQSAPPAQNNRPRTPHTLPVTQHHRTPCVRPKTQGSQAVAGWCVGGLSWRHQVDGKKHGEIYVTSNTSFWQEIFRHHYQPCNTIHYPKTNRCRQHKDIHKWT
jgi:hypothetical protein